MSDERELLMVDLSMLSPAEVERFLADARASGADLATEDEVARLWSDEAFSFERLEINPADRVPSGFVPHEGVSRAQRRAATRKGRGRGR